MARKRRPPQPLPTLWEVSDDLWARIEPILQEDWQPSPKGGHPPANWRKDDPASTAPTMAARSSAESFRRWGVCDASRCDRPTRRTSEATPMRTAHGLR